MTSHLDRKGRLHTVRRKNKVTHKWAAKDDPNTYLQPVVLNIQERTRRGYEKRLVAAKERLRKGQQSASDQPSTSDVDTTAIPTVSMTMLITAPTDMPPSASTDSVPAEQDVAVPAARQILQDWTSDDKLSHLPALDSLSHQITTSDNEQPDVAIPEISAPTTTTITSKSPSIEQLLADLGENGSSDVNLMY